VACWLVRAALLWTTVPKVDPFTRHKVSLLPEIAPSRQAAEAIRKHLPDGSSLSEAVIVFERRDGLLSADDMLILPAFVALTGRVGGGRLAE
jgi:uncharacterized membrane protein YdfJ with MMPL/SSD domain